MSKSKAIARTYRVRGRVQGVGFRYFVKDQADAIGIRGMVRNEDDGSVFVYATGDPDAMEKLAGAIHKGPRFAEVRGVEVADAETRTYTSFTIES